jgi:hypothetical protein
MSKDIDIHDTLALFSSNADDMVGFITYEGDLGGHVPQEIHIDTENRTMSVVFENGQEEKICDISKENVDTVNKLYAELREAKKDVFMGFWRMDDEHRPKKPNYDVPVLVM